MYKIKGVGQKLLWYKCDKILKIVRQKCCGFYCKKQQEQGEEEELWERKQGDNLYAAFLYIFYTDYGLCKDHVHFCWTKYGLYFLTLAYFTITQWG